MRTSTGRARLGPTARRPRPAASNPNAQPTDRPRHRERRWARTTDELIAAARTQLEAPAAESAVVVGITDGCADAIEQTDMDDGEAPVLASIQSLLRDSASVAMVVFTDHTPPQWVIQPCFLLRDVAVVSNPRGDQ
jgi:hypothetical protein